MNVVMWNFPLLSNLYFFILQEKWRRLYFKGFHISSFQVLSCYLVFYSNFFFAGTNFCGRKKNLKNSHFMGINFLWFCPFLDKICSFSQGFFKFFDKSGKNCIFWGFKFLQFCWKTAKKSKINSHEN